MLLNHTDIALTAEDLAIYHQEDYWISPVLFDDEEVQTMRRELDAYALASVTTTASSG